MSYPHLQINCQSDSVVRNYLCTIGTKFSIVHFSPSVHQRAQFTGNHSNDHQCSLIDLSLLSPCQKFTHLSGTSTVRLALHRVLCSLSKATRPQATGQTHARGIATKRSRITSTVPNSPSSGSEGPIFYVTAILDLGVSACDYEKERHNSIGYIAQRYSI